MVRFDAYTATTLAANYNQLADLFGSGLEAKHCPGYLQFDHQIKFKDDTGQSVGSVLWGGRQGERAMIEVKGERSPEVVERLRSAYPHRCTRMDSAADFDGPGAFQSLLDTVMVIKVKHRLVGERRGDWQHFPERGRTQYIGSTQSVTRLRLYEKGRQEEYAHLDKPDWTRAEVQVRPGKEARDEFSQVSAVDAWGASGWSRELAGLILADHVDPHPAGTVWRKSERDSALLWACRQYGAHFVSLKNDLGSWEAVGLTINEYILEGQRQAARSRGH
jgi:hypothetical protein